MARTDFPAEAVSPDPETPLVPGEDGLTDDERIASRLDSFSSALSKKRGDYINARAAKGVDRRWAEDVDQYNGVDAANKMSASMMESVEQGFPVTSNKTLPTRSTVFVQATRFQTNTGYARINDVAFPTDERNFSIEPTPIPNMPKLATAAVAAAAQQAVAGQGAAGAPPAASATPSATGGSPPTGMSTVVQQAANGAGGGAAPAPQAPQSAGGQPAPQGAAPGGAPAAANDPNADMSPQEQQIIAQHAEAKKRSDAMEEEIEDCLDECDFNAEARRMQFDRAMLGVGVMLGPVVVKRTGRKWSKTTEGWSLEMVDELRPASFRVDPQCFYPDPDCGENVQNGSGAFRYERVTKKQIRLLAKQPGYIPGQLRKVLEQAPEVGHAIATATQQEDRNPMTKESYEHWFYWGEVEKDDLMTAGVDIPDDELATISACIEMINSTVVRAYLNPLPDGALPYDMVSWERQPGSVWGFGVPYLMRAQQRVINSAWRMLLDNAGVSAGPQVVIKDNAISPADGDWTITSRKIWKASEDVEDVTKAFATFEFNLHTNDLSTIIEMAQKLAEAESAVPQDMSQQGATPETLGALQILMNAKNVVLRRLVKDLDDCVLKPHIRRYYDYLMEYSDRDDIKGDFQIKALGATSLVVRDIQNQAMVQMLALASNPTYAPFINVQKLFEKALRAQHIEPLDIMNTPAEIVAAQQRMAQAAMKPDPRVQAAEARAQADETRTQAQVQMNSQTLQAKRDVAQSQEQLQLQIANIDREVEIMRMAQKQNMSIEQIRADLAKVAMQVRSEQDMQANEIHVRGAHELAA